MDTIANHARLPLTHKFNIQIFVLIALVNFVAHFWLYHDFGLYEDDYFRFPQYMVLPWSQVSQQIQEFILNPAIVQGRPLHEIFILLGAFFGGKLGGIAGSYFIAYWLSNLNAILMFVWVKLSTRHLAIALLSSLLLILFPTDTNQIWLTGAFGIRPSLAFLFLAFIFYYRHQWIVAYGLMFLSLFCYETIYFIFLFAPLLYPSRRQPVKQFLINLLILLILLVTAIAIRKITGESRISDLDYIEALQMGGNQIFLGIGSILRSYPAAIDDVWTQSKPSMLLVLSACVLMGGTYWLLQKTTQEKLFGHPLPRPFYQFLLIALGMIPVSYPLNLTTSADRIEGVYSRVHMGASVGMSFLLALIVYWVLVCIKNFHFRQLVLMVISFWLFILINFGYFIQQDYAKNWDNQKVFWNQLIPLISDVNNGDLVLVEAAGLNERISRQMRGTDWNTPPILASIYQFPLVEVPAPRVYLLTNDWQEKTLDKVDKFLLTATNLVASPTHTPIPDYLAVDDLQKIILIKTEKGKMYRSASDTVQGRRLEFKSRSDNILSALEPGILFDEFFLAP